MADSAHPAWPGVASVRFRTAAAATIVVGVTLAVAGIALYALASARLNDSVRTDARARAADIAALAGAGTLPVPLPARGGGTIAQVVSDDGTVRTASADMPSPAPPLDLLVAPGETVVRRVVWPFDTEAPTSPEYGAAAEPAWLVAVGVRTPTGNATVRVIASLEPAQDALDVFAPLLAAILPLVLAITAAAVWTMAGRTLRPVEAIRARADAITSHAADAHVPVPAGRDEVHDLAVTINQMLDRLHAAADEQRRFIADASHELRSPVAAIRTMLEVAERYPDAVPPAELIADLLREDRRLERLTDDLLTLARHDEAGPALRRGAAEPIDVVDLLREEAAAVQALRRAAVHVDVSALPPVAGDRERLARAVRNVLDNAVRHARSAVWVEAWVESRDVGAGRTVRADGGATGGRRAGEGSSTTAIVVRIRDDGAGIAPADRERIFERFVRLDEGRGRAEGGFGLGLAVGRAIIEAHGGTIRVVDGASEGATFEIRLPAQS